MTVQSRSIGRMATTTNTNVAQNVDPGDSSTIDESAQTSNTIHLPPTQHAVTEYYYKEDSEFVTNKFFVNTNWVRGEAAAGRMHYSDVAALSVLIDNQKVFVIGNSAGFDADLGRINRAYLAAKKWDENNEVPIQRNLDLVVLLSDKKCCESNITAVRLKNWEERVAKIVNEYGQLSSYFEAWLFPDSTPDSLRIQQEDTPTGTNIGTNTGSGNGTNVGSIAGDSDGDDDGTDPSWAKPPGDLAVVSKIKELTPNEKGEIMNRYVNGNKYVLVTDDAIKKYEKEFKKLVTGVYAGHRDFKQQAGAWIRNNQWAIIKPLMNVYIDRMLKMLIQYRVYHLLHPRLAYKSLVFLLDNNDNDEIKRLVGDHYWDAHCFLVKRKFIDYVSGDRLLAFKKLIIDPKAGFYLAGDTGMVESWNDVVQPSRKKRKLPTQTPTPTPQPTRTPPTNNLHPRRGLPPPTNPPQRRIQPSYHQEQPPQWAQSLIKSVDSVKKRLDKLPGAEKEIKKVEETVEEMLNNQKRGTERFSDAKAVYKTDAGFVAIANDLYQMRTKSSKQTSYQKLLNLPNKTNKDLVSHIQGLQSVRSCIQYACL